MTRLPVIAMLLAISACEHGETPPPGCGNRIVDFGEQCDDGNDVVDDGCDQCVANTCGNGRFDELEECDDGNTVGGDGCSAECTVENFTGFVTLLWSVQNFAQTQFGCPADVPTLEFVGDGALGGDPITQAFDCNLQNASLTLPRDLYQATMTLRKLDGSAFAVSRPNRLDVRVFDASMSADFFTDAGQFEVAWRLVGAQSGNVVNCTQADIASIEVSTQQGLTAVFACSEGSGFSSVLPVGSYTISLTAKDDQQGLVASASGPAVEITVPVGLSDAGTISLTIPGL